MNRHPQLALACLGLFALAHEARAEDKELKADKQRLIGRWDFAPDGENFRLNFEKGGKGWLESPGEGKPIRRAFRYNLVKLGEDRLLVAKGDAFPDGNVMTYSLPGTNGKVLWFSHARFGAPWTAGAPLNRAGGWSRVKKP